MTNNPYLPTDEELKSCYEYLQYKKSETASEKNLIEYNYVIKLLNVLDFYKKNKCSDSELLYLREALSYTE